MACMVKSLRFGVDENGPLPVSFGSGGGLFPAMGQGEASARGACRCPKRARKAAREARGGLGAERAEAGELRLYGRRSSIGGLSKLGVTVEAVPAGKVPVLAAGAKPGDPLVQALAGTDR